MQGRDLNLKNGTIVRVRTVRPSEARKVLALMNKVYHKNDLLELNPGDVEKLKRKELRAQIKDYEKSKRQIMLGVYFEKKIVAYCTVTRVSENEKQSHRAALSIAIAEEFRGLGCGAALMKLAFDFASKVAYEQFEATILDGNTPAFILFTEYGFKAMCRIPRAFKNMKGAYQDSILLIKYLNNYET